MSFIKILALVALVVYGIHTGSAASYSFGSLNLVTDKPVTDYKAEYGTYIATYDNEVVVTSASSLEIAIAAGQLKLDKTGEYNGFTTLGNDKQKVLALIGKAPKEGEMVLIIGIDNQKMYNAADSLIAA